MSEDNLMVCFDGGFSKREKRCVMKAIKRKLHNHSERECMEPKRTKVQHLPNGSESTGDNEVNDQCNRVNLWPSNHRDTDDVSRYISLDCEFVGVGPRKLSALGRCSIVNFNNKVLLDIYARPEESITDYRTPWSGIRARDMRNAIPFEFAQNTIKNVLKGKILIGHALFNDLSVLKIQHPAADIRDTAKCLVLKKLAGFPANGSPVGLKKLANILLGRSIQKRWHCSIEDAKATMDLFKLSRKEKLKNNFSNQKPSSSQSTQHNVGNKWTHQLTISQHSKEESPDRNALHQSVKSRRQRRLSWNHHPYFKDEFWPSDEKFD